MTKTLTAINLSKRHKKRTVVDGLSLSIKSGEIIGLLGPNGAGKTTYFYMILGLVPIDGGQVLLDSEDITALPLHERARRGIGYLPQEVSIFRKLTVEENILAILETRPELSASEREAVLNQLLEEFKIAHLRKSLGIRLSGGERRRVEIARALTTQPAFILLDEPFAGVDPRSIADLKQIIQALAKKRIGVLITDHNVRDTLDICQRAYIVNEGKLVAEGSPTYVLNHPKVREVYLGEQFQG